MMLSDHFSLEELIFSQTATRLGLDNSPNAFQIASLKRLCQTILEPLREALGRPLHINSGYRSTNVNRADAGSINSAHMRGCAADVTAQGLTPEQMAQVATVHRLPFQQVILEFGSWLHIAIPDKLSDSPARETLIATRSRLGTIYKKERKE